MLSSFYVDDLLAGANTPEVALQLQQQLRQLLLNGGFDLRKWRSNSTQVLQNIDTTLHEKIPTKSLTDDHSSEHPKALGMVWDSISDTMSVSVGEPKAITPTKRGVISDIARTFDVFGWLAPSLIVMKIMFQRLWELKLSVQDFWTLFRRLKTQARTLNTYRFRTLYSIQYHTLPYDHLIRSNHIHASYLTHHMSRPVMFYICRNL